jgi:hypothetical protein
MGHWVVCPGLGIGEAAIGSLQDSPTQDFGPLAVLGFGRDVIDRLGEHLYDMEPVDDGGGVFERLAVGEEGAARLPRDNHPLPDVSIDMDRFRVNFFRLFPRHVILGII